MKYKYEFNEFKYNDGYTDLIIIMEEKYQMVASKNERWNSNCHRKNRITKKR